MHDDIHPVGVYNDVEVLDCGWDKSKEKGTLYLWVKYQTGHGTIVGRHYLTSNTADRFAKMLTDIGFSGSSLKDPGLEDGTALQGCTCQITVEHEEWDGKSRARVAWVNQNNSTGGSARLTGSDVASSLDAFDILFRKATGIRAEQDDVPF